MTANLDSVPAQPAHAKEAHEKPVVPYGKNAEIHVPGFTGSNNNNDWKAAKDAIRVACGGPLDRCLPSLGLDNQLNTQARPQEMNLRVGGKVERTPAGDNYTFPNGSKAQITNDGVRMFDARGKEIPEFARARDGSYTEFQNGTMAIFKNIGGFGDPSSGSLEQKGSTVQFNNGRITDVQNGSLSEKLPPYRADAPQTRPNDGADRPLDPKTLGSHWDQAFQNGKGFARVNAELATAAVDAFNKGGLPAVERLKKK